MTSLNARPDVDITQRRLLQSVVEMARIIFGAAAASVFLIDQTNGDLVFEAVAGEGEGHLVGSRFPSGTGIAGWTAMYGQPLLVDDLTGDPQFAREAAESTGYLPRSIMAAPLITEGECVGVLEVLDHDSRPRCDLGDLDSLGLLTTQLAAVLELLTRVRWMDGGQPGSALLDAPLLLRVADRLPRASGPVSATVTKLLAMADELLASDDAAVGTISA